MTAGARRRPPAPAGAGGRGPGMIVSMAEAATTGAAGLSDATLTARIRALLGDAAGAASLRAVRPDPRTVVIDAHAPSNYLPLLTPAVRTRLVAAVQGWLPEVEAIRFDPHH